MCGSDRPNNLNHHSSIALVLIFIIFSVTVFLWNFFVVVNTFGRVYVDKETKKENSRGN